MIDASADVDLLQSHQALEEQHRRRRSARPTPRPPRATMHAAQRDRVPRLTIRACALLRAAAAEPAETAASPGASRPAPTPASAIGVANASTRQLSETSAVNGNRLAPAARRPDQDARPGPTPATPPSAPSTRLSVSSCATSRPRLAPSATANGHLFLASRASREQQVGEIGAGDQQHQHDGAERDIDRLAQGDRRPAAVERFDRDAPILLPGWDRVGDLRADRQQVGMRLLERHAGLQSADRIQPMRAGRAFLRREGIQSPEARRLLQRTRAMTIERARRQHADDAMRLVVEAATRDRECRRRRRNASARPRG